jgi:hypothetical protein
VIEVADVNKILQYGITFFVTTGTIRVQGSKYKHFAEKEFPILKEILAIVLDSMAKINNAIDKHTEVEDETTLKTVDSAVHLAMLFHVYFHFQSRKCSMFLSMVEFSLV